MVRAWRGLTFSNLSYSDAAVSAAPIATAPSGSRGPSAECVWPAPRRAICDGRLLVQVLKQCGDDLSRENVMRQAASLRDYEPSGLLPGIKINTGPENFRPIKQMRLVQFDGRTWQPIGDVLETAFSDAPHK